MTTLFLDDAFGQGVDLSLAITNLDDDYTWPVTKLLNWQERGIETLTARIEWAGGVLEIIPSAPRGGVRQPQGRPVDQYLDLPAIHCPVGDSVMADEALKRQIGRTTMSAPEQLRNDRLRQMRRSLNATIAAHRMGALKGLIIDADGSTLIDLFSAFGATQQTQDYALDTAANILTSTVNAQRKSIAALDGLHPPEKFVAMCSPGFMDAARASSSYKELARDARPRDAMSAGSFVIDHTEFVEINPPSGFSQHLGVLDGEALLCPLDVPDLYLARFSPADTVEAVGDIGVPYYVQAERMPFGRGYELAGQTNIIHAVSRPRAVIRLTA